MQHHLQIQKDGKKQIINENFSTVQFKFLKKWKVQVDYPQSVVFSKPKDRFLFQKGMCLRRNVYNGTISKWINSKELIPEVPMSNASWVVNKKKSRQEVQMHAKCH